MARSDLLRAISRLATKITRWTADCDHELHRLMSYIQTTTTLTMSGWIGDAPEDIEVALFADADFASDPNDPRSTTASRPNSGDLDESWMNTPPHSTLRGGSTVAREHPL